MTYKTIANSEFLNLTAYQQSDGPTVVDAYGLDPDRVFAYTDPLPGGGALHVGIFLKRANDPEALLSSDWATRQATIQSLTESGELWKTYGTDQVKFDFARDYFENVLNLKVLDSSNSNYITSAPSQSIWIEIQSGEQFKSVFGVDLMFYDSPEGLANSLAFWNGELKIDSRLDVAGIWFDSYDLRGVPQVQNFAGDTTEVLVEGWQSPGNALAYEPYDIMPQSIASLYSFPLDGLDVKTGLVALAEPAIGGAVPQGAESLGDLLRSYTEKNQQQKWVGDLTVQGVDGQIAWTETNSAVGERDLDVSVVASVNPNSDLRLYVGSGVTGNAAATPMTSVQSAIWDTIYNPQIISTSYDTQLAIGPDSPFLAAIRGLAVDAALRNQTLFAAAGDRGSNGSVANGLPNIVFPNTSPYALAVGGSSVSLAEVATKDLTLKGGSGSLVELALSRDPYTLRSLVAGGLKLMPGELAGDDFFVETVWNENLLAQLDNIAESRFIMQDYTTNNTGAGGVDISQPTPSYQDQAGLTPRSVGPDPQVGRGVPDVVANAGGNLYYTTLDSGSAEVQPSGGTSAAAPLWASLFSQMNVIFADQGLPNLGYANDLLYTAYAISPGSFNDISIGNNTTSFRIGGDIVTGLTQNSSPTLMTATGFGYEAQPGYDLASGLGSPNGTLLARALTSIAHSQLYFSDQPAVLDVSSELAWVSGADQSLIFQPNLYTSNPSLSLSIGQDTYEFLGTQADQLGWDSRLAQMSLQSDFSPELVTFFDGYSLGPTYQANARQGEVVNVVMDGTQSITPRIGMTSPYGFVDFVSEVGLAFTSVSRPVAIATTALGADDQIAVVRMRQNGVDNISLKFYQVDDLLGSIDGILPGDQGYASLVDTRAYQTIDGSSTLSGPGYGQYAEALLSGVDGGDIIAMSLTNGGNAFYGFAQANEQVDGQSVAHLRNFGLNTWGWEDQYGGGDFDFNDLIVQLDFTSSAGAGLIA
jgi:hypothetical protein